MSDKYDIKTVEISTPSRPNVFFTSDLHFDHENVIDYCGRPFKTTEEMNERIIADHNAVVRRWDRVVFVGDIGWKDGRHTMQHLARMNGAKELVKGNHDHHKDLAYMQAAFGGNWTHYKEFDIEGDKVCVSHFPLLSWHKMNRGSYHIHGHCHGEMQYPSPLNMMRVFDAGIDHAYKLTGKYAPLTWTQIKDFLRWRIDGSSINHHTGAEKTR